MATTQGAAGGSGTNQSGITQSTIFDDLHQTVQTTTATYPDAPTDIGTPTTDVIRWVRYSTGQYVQWAYDVSQAQWVAVEGAPVS